MRVHLVLVYYIKYSAARYGGCVARGGAKWRKSQGLFRPTGSVRDAKPGIGVRLMSSSEPIKLGSGAYGPSGVQGQSPWPSSLVLVEASGWHRLIPGASRVATRAAHAAGGAGTVVLSSDRAVKRLNARHRRRNKPTNVLTFEPLRGFAGGDIVLALETVRREARAA